MDIRLPYLHLRAWHFLKSIVAITVGKDAARGRNIQQVIVPWPNFQPAATFGGCVQSCWDVLGCWDLLCCRFILGQDLAIVSYCFSLWGYYLSRFGSRVWCSKIKIIKILQSRHISYRGSVGRVSTRACPLFVHVSCLFVFLALGPHPVPAPTKSSSRSVVSNYISRSDVSVHWLVWHHYN